MMKPKILSIDDEASFTDLLRQYFEPRGYNIDVASDGTKGLELLRNNEYDVVLLDIKMAGLSGEDVMMELKKMNSPVKTIFITAYNDAGKTSENLLREGAYAFIEKPVTSLKDLEDLINKAANAA